MMRSFGELTEERRDQLVENIVKRVVQYGMVTPAIFFLEMNKPLSYIGSQAMHFFSPIVSVLFSSFDEYAYFFEERENIERILIRLEQASAEMEEKERAARAAAKKQGPSKGGLLKKLLGR